VSLDASPNSVSLLPTDGIKDPQVRNFLDRLTEAWGARNDGADRFISRSEFSTLAAQSVLDLLGGTSGQTQGPSVQTQIDGLTKSIVNSILHQKLGSLIDVEDLRSRIDEAVQYASAGISREAFTRSTSDMAIASAINRIWGYVGGATAVIEDGALAAATPSSAVATRWDSVIAAVTDPNTGLVNSASIVEELDTYANSANSTFNAIYSVRAQISSGGQTLLGGFGLAATSGAGSAQGPTINFGVRADQFYVAGTSSTPDLTTQLAGDASIPFIVVTSPQTIGGIAYSPGVYMKSAFIVDATITNAKIADAAITTAKIGSAQVDTLQLAGQAVTIPQSAYTAGQVSGTGQLTAQQITVTSTGAPALLIFGAHVYSPQNEGLRVTLYRGGTLIFQEGPGGGDTTVQLAGQGMVTATVIDTPGAGAHTYYLYVENVNGYAAYTSARCITFLEVKR
jgi:hypothetical protein